MGIKLGDISPLAGAVTGKGLFGKGLSELADSGLGMLVPMSYLAKSQRDKKKKGAAGKTGGAEEVVAMEAGEAGADYIAFGAFFPTATKQVSHHAEPEILNWWQSLFEIPCVAIGGITPVNCAPLVAAGADFLAVSAAIWSGDERAAVTAFHAAIAGASSGVHSPG